MGKLEDNRGCIDEKAGQNAIPLVLLRLVALQKLAGAHREVASLLNGSAGHDVGHENTAIVVALREDVVGVVCPGIEFDLVVRVGGFTHRFWLEDMVQHVVRY